MEIHQIRYFQAIAECGSFTAAAKRQHVSQPTLSHQVMKLEREIGAQLFHRMGRVARLTEAGTAFLQKAETILQQIDLAKSQVREIVTGESGAVVLGVIPTVAPFFLPRLLSRFVREHPAIDIKVVEEASITLLNSVREGSVDMAIVPLPVAGKWVVANELLSENLYAVVSPEHPMRDEKQLTLKQLAGAPFLFLKDGHCFREDALTSFRTANIVPRIVFESGCFLTILNMVRAGFGVSVVPEMAVDVNSGCRFIPIRGDRPVRKIGLVQSKQRVATRAQREFAEFVLRSKTRAASAV